MADEKPEDEPSESTPAVNEHILEVMANPFRQRTYDTLVIFGDMTARTAAKLTTISEAALSRYLEQLAEIEFVRVLNPDAPKRQRIWHALRGGVGEFITGDYAESARAWYRSQIESQAHILQDWIDVQDTWPPQWREPVERWDYVLKALTAEQFEQLGKELNALANKWWTISKQQEAAGTPNTRTTYLITQSIPWPIHYDALDDNNE